MGLKGGCEGRRVGVCSQWRGVVGEAAGVRGRGPRGGQQWPAGREEESAGQWQTWANRNT